MRETLVKTEEFKDSPVGRIPKDWELRKLTDIASYQNGKSFPSLDYSESGRPLLRPGNLPDDDFVLWDEAHTTYLPLKWAELAPDYIVLGEELVMNLTAQSLDDQFLGRVCMTPPDTFCLLNQRIARFRAKDCYLPFLFWALKGTYFRAQIDRIPQGTKVQHIYNSDLDAIILPMPKEQSEQRAITEILFTLSALVRSQESLIAKLKLMKAGLLHDLLTRGLDENGELRDAIGHPEQFQDSPLGRIPKDWEATTIGEQASTSSGSTPNRSNPKYWQDGTIAWVKTGEVNYTFIQDTEEKVTQKALSETSLTVYPVDTVLMAMYGQGVTRGKVGILGIEATTNQACAAIIPKDNKLVSRYLFHYLSYYYDEIRSISHGSNQSNLNERLIASFPIQLPPIKEQIRIVEMIDIHDTRIRTEEAYRDKLKLQKQGLMHDLLTGKVRVNSLGDK
ncbi:restriction endonuclease subunit S [Microcoleus sp. D3_18_C4]|uniref:restriction endonuclease subunit S n=1 Tax=Microcoleus sp. D3_18_C4 TaxID=3055335 RepID=UPI002FCF1936